MAASLETLFSELDDVLRGETPDLEKVLSISNKVLTQQPRDKEGLQCKVVALIQTSKYEEALSVIDSATSWISPSNLLAFERAYCLYRLCRYDEALQGLSSFSDPKPEHVLQLLAQIYYRKELFDKSVSTYESVIKTTKNKSPELITNLTAAYVSSGALDKLESLYSKEQELTNESFEFAYNVASGYVEKKDVVKARSLLTKAIETGKTVLEDLSKEELDQELAIVNVQLGYISQLEHKNEQAMEHYNAALNAKPSDLAVVAVASNNIVSLQKDHNLFDSEKKLKHTTGDGVEHKLLNEQKQAIAFNKALLLLKMKKIKEAKESLQVLEQKFPDSFHPLLLKVSLLIREKNVEEAEKLLRKHLSNPKDQIVAGLSLAQIHLNANQSNEAIECLRAIESIKHKPALVAAVVLLYEQKNDIEAAAGVFEESLQYWEKKQSGKDIGTYALLAKEAGAFNMKYKRYKQAADVYQRLVKMFPNDNQILASLVIALSSFAPKEAEKYANKLPSTTSTKAKLDLDALENISSTKLNSALHQDEKTKSDSTTTTTTTTKAKSETSDKQKTTKDKDTTLEKKKKKKKKKKPCKNFDPNKVPDPERWLPLHQRSTFKKRPGQAQKKPANLRGASQGSVPDEPEEEIKAQPAKGAVKGQPSKAQVKAQASKGQPPKAQPPKGQPPKAQQPKAQPTKAQPQPPKSQPPKDSQNKKKGKK